MSEVEMGSGRVFVLVETRSRHASAEDCKGDGMTIPAPLKIWSVRN